MSNQLRVGGATLSGARAPATMRGVRATPHRWRVLPSRGRLLISTDLHGNLDDFRALERRFERAREAGVDVHWALLGDFVHGPSDEAAARDPAVHGYPDESPALVDAVVALQARAPERVHVLLGNHDAGHLGFARTSKFHPDEVRALDTRLTPAQAERLTRLFGDALLLALCPNGLVLTHGVPGDALTTLGALDGPLPPTDAEPGRARAVNELLWSYGQRGDVVERLLARLRAETGLPLTVVVHGHDRDPAGWYVEGGNQAQPVIFGAPRENKRCLWVDLACPVSLDGLARPDVLLPVHEP